MEEAVVREVCRLLQQETNLFRSITDTEREKRRHIAVADGRLLQELTRRTEMLLVEAEALSGRRAALSTELVGEPASETSAAVTLRRMVDAVLDSGLPEAGELEHAARAYRDQVQSLQGEVSENQRLLRLAARSLGRMMSGLREAADDSDTYQPGNQPPRRTQSVLLNANA